MVCITRFAMLCVLCAIVKITVSLKARFYCEGANFRSRYREIFSISLHVRSTSVAFLNKDQIPEIIPNSSVSVANLSGALTQGQAFLNGQIDIDCDMADSILCELYGLTSSTEEYKRTVFAANLEFNVGLSNTSLTQHSNETSSEIVLTCSAVVGSNRTTVSWQSRVPKGHYSTVNDLLYNVKKTFLPQCYIRFTSRLKYTNGQGPVVFRCMYGETEVGSISVGLNGEDPPMDGLTRHLFLSSIVLVYSHFVIIPTVCAFLQRRKLIGALRDPENEPMRMIRGGISFCVATMFFVWWVWLAIVTDSRSQSAYSSYLSFFLIEVFFLLVYAIIRLLSHRLEKPGDRHLYNGRVALSCGAVITPTICWIMIKSQQNIPTGGLEIFWWIVTLMSLIAFVFVSHERELKAWEKIQ